MDFPAIFLNKLRKLEKKSGETEVCGVLLQYFKIKYANWEKNNRQKSVGFPAIFKKKTLGNELWVQVVGHELLWSRDARIPLFCGMSLSDTVLFLNMYECFMNTKYLCACLKRYHVNLSLKQG